MAWKFLNIGKANAEIERLGLEVANITKERDDLKTAMESNGAETIKALEDSQAKVTAHEATITALTAERDTAKAELAKVQADAKGVEVKVQTAASHKAAEITGAQGQPPIPSTPNGTPAGAAAASPEDLTAQIAAIKDPVARTVFVRKHMAAIKAASRAERNK